MTTTRKNIMLGTAGHVDHGKSALVKLLTGCETDTLAEEKQRGLTIDLGFAPCRLSDQRVVGVVDVPGHVDFIRNMVAGAHGIDVVIFVVAADDGIMPQTHEHLRILTLMGLRHGLVALTKIDLVDMVRHSKVITSLRQLLARTFLEDAPICPISNITGEGFDNFFDTLNDVVRTCEDRPCSGVFRVWVEDVFTIRGSGTVVTGIPTSGVTRPGDALQLLPSEKRGHVRRMQVYGEDATEGRAGECVALNVPELDHSIIRRGMVLCEPDVLAPVTMAEAEFQVLASLKEPLKDNFEAHLHVGTSAELVRVAMLEANEMSGGQQQMIQLRLDEPLPLAPGERFVLRANAASAGQSGLTTIGGGRILGTSNTRLRRNKQWTLDTLVARRTAMDDPGRWVELMLRESSEPMTPANLQRRCMVRAEEAALLVDGLRASGSAIVTASGALVHAATVERVAAKVQSIVQAFHAANPQSAGMGRDALQTAVGANAELFELSVDSLTKGGRIEWSGTVFAQPGWSARLSNHDEQLCAQVEAVFKKAGWTSPATTELAPSLGVTPQQLEKTLRLLQERGALLRLDERMFMHRDAMEAAKQVALRLFAIAPSFTTMDFRDALRVSRKFAVPLLDQLDRVRFTVRSGNSRTPGVEAKKQITASLPGQKENAGTR
jgi:selenocysteine-specific elongation factor